MLDCCSKYFLGSFLHTEDKTFTQLLAPDAGVYTFYIKYLGVVKKITATFDAGDILAIPSSQYLSEDQMFEINIKAPDGSYISFAYTSCFTFKTVYEITTCEPCNELPYGLTHPYSIDNDSAVNIGTM